jgi:hypothetical protein
MKVPQIIVTWNYPSQQFRSNQNNIAYHLPAFEQRICLCRLEDRKFCGDDGFDLAPFQKFEQRCPIFKKHAPVESRGSR